MSTNTTLLSGGGSSVIDFLKSNDGAYLYPITLTNAIYDLNGERLDTVLSLKANTNDLTNYLPITGGILSGRLAITYDGDPHIWLESSTGVYTHLLKNASLVNNYDYGTALVDGSADGKQIYLRLSSAEQSFQIVRKQDASSSEADFAAVIDSTNMGNYVLPLSGGTMRGGIYWPANYHFALQGDLGSQGSSWRIYGFGDDVYHNTIFLDTITDIPNTGQVIARRFNKSGQELIANSLMDCNGNMGTSKILYANESINSDTVNSTYGGIFRGNYLDYNNEMSYKTCHILGGWSDIEQKLNVVHLDVADHNKGGLIRRCQMSSADTTFQQWKSEDNGATWTHLGNEARWANNNAWNGDMFNGGYIYQYGWRCNVVYSDSNTSPATQVLWAY